MYIKRIATRTLVAPNCHNPVASWEVWESHLIGYIDHYVADRINGHGVDFPKLTFARVLDTYGSQMEDFIRLLDNAQREYESEQAIASPAHNYSQAEQAEPATAAA